MSISTNNSKRVYLRILLCSCTLSPRCMFVFRFSDLICSVVIWSNNLAIKFVLWAISYSTKRFLNKWRVRIEKGTSPKVALAPIAMRVSTSNCRCRSSSSNVQLCSCCHSKALTMLLMGELGALFLLLYSGAKISSFNCLNMMWWKW